MNQSLSHFGIGASEIAAVCGMNPFSGPWDIWLRKTGQAPDIEPGPPIEWGHRLEPAIRQKYADETGATMFVPSESLFSKTTPWARATPDAIVLTLEQLWDYLVQVKNVGYWMGKDWEATPPAYVQLQEQWELYVTELQRADVAVLIAGSDYRAYTVHRDDKMIGDLLEIAADFWRHVENRTPPKLDASEACRDHFTRRLVRAPVVELTADEDAERTIAAWHAAKATLKRAASDVERYRNTVLSTLNAAQADRIRSSLGVPKLARTKPSEHKSTDWKYVAEMLATATGAGATLAELVAAATTTTTTSASVSLREPHEWSKEHKL